MLAKITININYGDVRIAVASKTKEVPNVYGAEGVDTTIYLCEKYEFKGPLSVSHVDLDTDIVELRSSCCDDLAEKVGPALIREYLGSLRQLNWRVDESKDTVQKLMFPEDFIEKENIVEIEKPKISVFVLTWLFLSALLIGSSFFLNLENILLMVLLLTLGSITGYFMVLRRYNKATSEQLSE
jgi:hypothetical protein